MSVKIVDVPDVLSTTAYVDDVRAVHDSGKAGIMTFPAEDVKTHVNRLHLAAKKLGVSVKTLAKVDREEGDNTVTDVTFIVRERQSRPRAESIDEDDSE